MQEQLNKPKRFGEILDTIFTLSRRHFIDFLKIFFIIIGPIYILQALIQLSSGHSLFIDRGEGSNFFERIINSFLLDVDETVQLNLGAEILTIITLLLIAIFMVIAQVAVLYAVDQIRRGEGFTVNEVIKRAFSRFWPLFRGGLLVTAIAIIAGVVLTFIAIIGAMILESISVWLLAIGGFVMFIGILIGVAFFTIRLSFYIAAIAFGDRAFSSLGTSWRLTSGRFWVIFGIYFVFSVIIGTVSTMFEIPLGLIFGNSVLFGLLISGVTLITTMLGAVGYAVVYLDLYVRHDSTDLKDMIAEYEYLNE